MHIYIYTSIDTGAVYMMTALGMDDIRCTPRVMDGITSSLDGMERLFTELVFCFFRKTIVDRPQMSRRLKQHMILYVIHPIYIYIFYIEAISIPYVIFGPLQKKIG